MLNILQIILPVFYVFDHERKIFVHTLEASTFIETEGLCFFPGYCRTRYIAYSATQTIYSSLVQNIASYAYTQITRARMLRRISMGRERENKYLS